jgi:hypothetical protein
METERTTAPQIPAQWTDDCQGKKDFDGHLVSISSRYWPRGGSAVIFQGSTFVSDGSDPARQKRIPPSAKSSIVIRVGPEQYEDTIDLIDAEFTAETEEEVKQQVEAWAAIQYARVIAALQAAFGPPRTP